MNINNGKTGNVNIPGALHSTGGDGDGQVGGVVAYAGDIYDVTLDKNLAEVNSGFTEAIDDINDNISSIQDDISPFTGSVNLQSLVEYDKIGVSEGINASQHNEVYINDKKLAMSFGYNNTISNDRKLAFGFGQQLNVPDNTFVIGQRNSYEPNAAFIVGNGTLNDSTNNAFVIGRDGNFWVYGINGYAGQLTGTSQYNSVNHFITGLDTRLTALEGITSSSSSAPTYSAGTVIIISNNTISVNTFQLNYDDLNGKPDLDPLIATHADRGVVLSSVNQRVYALGNQSVAYGHSTNADGDYAIAGGSGTRAWGDKSVAFGTDTIAFGDNTIAAGNKSIAVGTESVAFGENAYTKGKASGYFGKGRSVSAYVVDSGVDVANSDPWYILTLESPAAGYPDGRGYEEFRVLPGMYITEYETDVNSEQPGWLIKNVEYIPMNLGWVCKVYIDDPNEDAPSDPQLLVVRGIVSEGYSYALGRYLFTTNQSEVAVGDYNVSHKSGGSAASGSGTIFSVGTGILSDNSEYIPESMADPENYLISNQTYRANALEVLTDGSVYVRGVGGYDGKSIANVDSLQTVITDVNTRLSDLEAASSSSSSSPEYITYSTGQGYSIGSTTTASGEHSFAEGLSTNASGNYSHAEGDRTIASGLASHAEGSGYYIHAYVHSAYTAGDTTIILERRVYPGQYLSRRQNERYDTVKVSDVYSHPSNPGIFEVSLEEGFSADLAYHNYVYIFGGALNYESHAEGEGCTADGWGSHAEGTGTTAFGLDAHSEGKETLAYGDCAHSEGKETLAYGNYSHTEGSETNAREGGHSEGNKTYAYGDYSHAEGHQTLAYGNYSHAEGKGYDKTVTVGSNYVERQTTIDLLSPVTPGQFLAITDNTNKYRFSEMELIKILGCQEDTNNLGHYIVTLQYGMNNSVNAGDTLHIYSAASGSYSHSEGNNTSASGDNSHAEGDHTSALNNAEHAEGKYNKSTVPANSGDPYTMSSIGIGTSETNRLNATEVMSNGDVYIKGIGGYDGTNIGANGVKSVQQVIADLTQQIAALSNN